MKNTIFVTLITLISFLGFSQKIKIKKSEIKINETTIGKVTPVKKGEKYDYQDVNGNHLFFGSYFTKSLSGSEDKVNYIEIKINENDEPASFNAESDINDLSLASFSFDNSREIVQQLFKKGFVSEEGGFDMDKITAFASSKGQADLTQSSTVERKPTDIGTNSKSDGTGLSAALIENFINEKGVFTIDGVEYNGWVSIIFNPLSMKDEEKLENADSRLVNYIKNIKEEEFGRRAILHYTKTNSSGEKQEELVSIKSKTGFKIAITKEDGQNYVFTSYEFEDNNLIGEGLSVLKMATKKVDDSALSTKNAEPVVFFNIISTIGDILILQDPVTNTLAVKIPANKKAMSINDMFVGTYQPKNLKRYLDCKSLNNEIDTLKSISDLEALLKKYQSECK
ncbi:hypothetical protein GOQ30_14975 [Flavobacterium sp. TP390]|uniref:Uncharacterized protein n=1 Tax=Flavobacterium profundi TaxID=1774945 RepID=A0A6I4IUC4_9FLAO|nr:hypothetical protein [Flavobacterium profundi]MVO10474.1 hypothetical protein [Flavobacterium profundi]